MAGNAWANADNSELDEECETEVVDAVVKVAARFNHLGRALGLNASDVAELLQTYSHNRQDGLAAVISLWLQQNYNVDKHGVPSWRKLVMAVESQSGGKNRALAKKIAADHPLCAGKPPQQQQQQQQKASRPTPMDTENAPSAKKPAPETDPCTEQAYYFSPTSPQPSAPPLPSKMEYEYEGSYFSDIPNQVYPPPSSHSPPPAYSSHNEVNKMSPGDCIRVVEDGGKSPYNKYLPINPDMKTKPTELTFGIVTPTKGKQKVVPYNEYEMKSFPHGICLIINNEEFARQNDREGTDIDEENLVLTFRYLGYIVEVHRDKTSDQITEIFDKMQQRDHSKYDSFVCCLLTHGKEGQIYGSDSKLVELSTLTGKLSGSHCLSLATKPKLFFIQACRGKGKDTAVRIDNDSDNPIEIPDEADFFFGYATPPGKVAWRDLDHGSWYVSELCRMLCTDATHVELKDIVTKVQCDVATYSNMQYKQAPEHTSRLQKSLYFF